MTLVVVAGYGLVEGLHRSGVNGLDELVVGGRIAVPVMTFVEAAWGLHRTKARGDSAATQKSVNKILTGLVVMVHDKTDLPVGAIGVSLWRVEEETLYRVDTVRLSGFPPPSNVEWKRGMGVLGWCWETEQTRYRDYRPIQARHRGVETLGPGEWRALRAANGTENFTQKDYLDRIRKYDQILAVPFVDSDGKFEGCISVDIGAGTDDEKTINTLAVRTAAAQAGVSLRDVVLGTTM
ncbi:hypothetical protein V2J56_09340 [Georgenia sp. MJ206]|uniref:hypothetical protein n=1 Tax=Georgenia wangjunii TaxID=3117730 RepID=UPI002F26C2F6